MRTYAANSALAVACATAASPIRPRRITVKPKRIPAMLPATQYPPCKRPKAAEDTKSANQEKCLKEMDSKSDEIRRRIKKPRNDNSSASEPVRTAANTRKVIHVMRAVVETLIKAAENSRSAM